jgi:hypothetical protein
VGGPDKSIKVCLEGGGGGVTENRRADKKVSIENNSASKLANSKSSDGWTPVLGINTIPRTCFNIADKIVFHFIPVFIIYKIY